MTWYSVAAGQRGMVLVVSLLVLLVLGLIATTVARTNLLQLHMAGNGEARIAALQQSLAAVDAVLAGGVSVLPISGGLGYRTCLPGSPNVACNERTVVLAPAALPATGQLDVAVTRVAPLLGNMPVMSEEGASSAVHFRVAKFEIAVAYLAAGQDAGRAALVQGVLVRLPYSHQSGGGTP